ncbi:hypothetical protein [Halorientalis marina]|uniref:hypothetical protein n=1 Tax=Halorientalis marina TaxID=2931976 RepID=UPI001FF6D508|nr:hypothetical protein [Halorientalis marina]
MSVDESTSASPETDQQPTHQCAICETSLEQSSQHLADNRETLVYSCPDCRIGAKAVVQQSGASSERCQRRFDSAQADAVTNPSVYTLAAFATDEFPDGQYHVTRIGEHTFEISLPESATQWDILRLVDRLSVGSLSAVAENRCIVVRDTRWPDTSTEPVPDGGIIQARIADGTVPDPADDPFAVADDDKPRTKRAKREEMDVSFHQKPGVYEVHSASGSYYEVDVIAETCTCPDFKQTCSDPDTPIDKCKHLRRVALEIEAGTVPRPDGKLPDK